VADESTQPIWELLASDTPKSWAAFVIYRDMGTNRSHQATHDQIYGKSAGNLRYIEQWSSAHNWVARCQAYDQYQYEQHQERKQAKQIEVENNAWKSYEAIQKVIVKRLEILESTNYTMATNEAQGLIDLVKRADDVARRITGLPDRISESKTDITSGGEKITWKSIIEDVLGDDDSTD